MGFSRSFLKATGLTDEQITAYRLADNKVSEFALWDMQTLNDELDDILNLDMDLFVLKSLL